MRLIGYYIFFLIVIIISACSKTNNTLKEAMKQAENNRIELEKAIAHYEKTPADSLKLKAVKFLIENMPGHYTLHGDRIDAIRKQSEAMFHKCYDEYTDNTGVKQRKDVYNNLYFSRKVLDVLTSHSFNNIDNSKRDEDITTITAEYLISHIDAMFRIKDNAPWLHDIPFDYFLEYLLPYRFEYEEIDSRIVSIKQPEIYSILIKYGEDFNRSILKAGSFLNSEEYLDVDREFINKYINIDFENNCFGAFTIEMMRLRIMGIPTALDFIPAHPNRNGRHYWCKIISPEAKDGELNIFKNYSAPKIYRRMYSKHQNFEQTDSEFMPELFKNPFYKDVTSEYLKSSDIVIENIKKFDKSPVYAYLTVFNNKKWEPIAISSFKEDNILFKDMGRNILYLPIYYKGNIKHSFNYPFILNSSGNIQYLVPNTERRHAATLVRKYPFSYTLYKHHETLNNIIIEGTNSPNWDSYDTISCVARNFGGNTSYKTQSDKKYRYYRIRDAKNDGISIAELYFRGDNDKQCFFKCDTRYPDINDNNPLSCAKIDAGNSFVADFGSPINIKEIICCPRCDGNGIYPNNEYELFYYELDGWRSLGRKTATSCFLEYDNLPEGALFWLRNLTNGVEERPFIIRNEKIIFW